MERLNFVKEGAIRLPPGFRFQPTDEEIVFQYLLRKSFACPLPASIIPEINVCKHDPWDLPGDSEQDRYFFSNKEPKYPNGTRINRATDVGYWKATGVDKQIASPNRNPIVGMRKTLVFYRGKPTHGSRTDWIMHEYRLVLTGNDSACGPLKSGKDVEVTNQATNDCDSKSSFIQIGNWILCHIFQKKRISGAENESVQICKDYSADNVKVSQPSFETSMIGNLSEICSTSSCRSLSSDSSVHTEVSCNQPDHDETSSHYF